MEPNSKRYLSYHDGMAHTRGLKCFYLEEEPVMIQLDDQSRHYYLPVSFSSDCLYDIDFMSIHSVQLMIESVDLVDGEGHPLTTLKQSNQFTSEKPLMLWLLSYYNKDNPHHVGILQYDIKYRGQGLMMYSSKQGFLSQSIRNYYLEQINQEAITIGDIVYYNGLCLKD